MAKKKYPSLKEYYDDIAREAVEKCTFCGECVDKCLSYPLSPLKDKDGCQVMQCVIDFLDTGTYSDDVYLRAFSCAQCGSCSDVCPQGIDPFLLLETTIVKLVEKGKQPPEAINFVLPGQKPNLVGVLSALQTKPSEARWLKRAPEQARKVENVVFLGCEPLLMPHKIFASLDVFEAMGLDFVTLAGGSFACGVPSALAAGNAASRKDRHVSW
jgi:Fe-S oxidoreductase